MVSPHSQSIIDILLKVGAVSLRTEAPYFTFASGITSPIYTDNRLIISEPSARRLICNAFVETIGALPEAPTVIAGTATAGIPHATSIADALDLPLVYVRGRTKKHGQQHLVEGRLSAGARVVVIEDLISTGASSIKAAEALREQGARVLAIISIFTYGFDESTARFASSGLNGSSLASFQDLLAVARQRGQIGSETINAEDIDHLSRWAAAPERWIQEGKRSTSASRIAQASNSRHRHAADAKPAPPEPSLIVAADLKSRAEIERLAECIQPYARWIKLNTAFVSYGPDLLNALRIAGLRIFLDLKFHDIPNTAANEVCSAAELGAGLVTIHASGGPSMIHACADALAKRPTAGNTPCRLLAVSALTSLSADDLTTIGIPAPREAHVARLAELAQENGADGLVASVAEVETIRRVCGPRFLIVTPGVRPLNVSADDHDDPRTPEAALRAGADYIVVGRPIYQASDYADATRRIAETLGKVAETLGKARAQKQLND